MSDIRGDWSAQIATACDLSPFAIELSALSESEIRGLERYLASEPSLPFRYLSIHGPSKGRSMAEERLVAELLELSVWADAVVMHPDTIENPELYRPLGRKLLLENMDVRKRDGRTAHELERWFELLPQAGFCFDIAHAWSVDPTMTIAGELLDAFRGRLRHLHLSSLSEQCHHVTLTEEHEELFGPLLARCVDVPWILEAPPRDL